MSNPENKRFCGTARGTAILLCLFTGLFSGCASWTNPVANGIPVRLLPDELLAESKEGFEYIPWGLLQRTPPKEPVIQPGDVLGVYIVGVLGSEDQLPPVQVPNATNVPPALGFPIPVRPDGTIPLPLIDDPKIAGLTVKQAENKIFRAYVIEKEFLREDQSIILTMIRPRHVRVLVIRQDSLGSRANQFVQTQRGGFLAAPLTTGNSSRQGAGFELDIPATEADILTALADTGGLPGLDAKDEILVYRKPRVESDRMTSVEQLNRITKPRRIPLKVKKGDIPQLSERDVSLRDGDIVVIESREPEQYYTTGLSINQEVQMPLNYDLTVVEALARVGGPLLNGGFGGANLNGAILSAGLGGPSPSQVTVLRKAPNGQQVPIRVDLNDALRDPRENILIKNGDVLVLQETTGESFARYLSSRFSTSFSGSLFRRSDAVGAAQAVFP